MWWHKHKAAPGTAAWKPAPHGQFPTADVPPSAPGGFAEAVERATAFMLRQLDDVPRPEAAHGSPDAAISQPFVNDGPAGHRARMRDRLLDRGPHGLADYELLEMLLFFAQPKGDTKRVAKRLINRFGTYAATLAADQRELLTVEGVGRHTVAAIKLAQASALRLAQAEILERPVLGNWDQLMGYLNALLGQEQIEHFRILFLGTKNQLIADEEQGKGTINHTPVYPREVLHRALNLHAAAIILVHNHPSGDPSPSLADIEMTMQIERAVTPAAIALHDHVIIGRGRWLSMRREGLL